MKSVWIVWRSGSSRLLLIYRLSVDITMEEGYLPWHVQRKKRGSAEIGSPPGDARSDGPESSRRIGAAAWLWDRPPDRAGERAGSAIERRNGLHISPAAPAAEMDLFR